MALARTMKRDYVRVNELPNSVSASRPLPVWFRPFQHRVHPHRALVHHASSLRPAKLARTSGHLRGLFQHEHEGYKVLPLMCEGVSLFLHRKNEPFDVSSETAYDDELGCSLHVLSERLAHDRELERQGYSSRPPGFRARAVDQPVALATYRRPSPSCPPSQAEPSLPDLLDH